MIAVALIVVLVAGSLALHAVAIRFGARWAKVPGVSFWRAARVTVLLFFVTLVLSAVAKVVCTLGSATPLVQVVLPLVLTVVAECLLVAVVFRVSVWRGVQIWLPRLGAAVVTLSFLFFVIKPFVAEGFIQGSHSMAPTLLGLHSPGTCPHCGGAATMSARTEPLTPHDSLGMCSACQQPGEVQGRPPIIASAADRFVVCKFLTPVRWDVVAVYSPAPSRSLGASRVVGLPGEEVVVRDGGIWINGTRQEPPADIAKLTYTTAPGEMPEGFGSPSHPTTLGPDEYFVIGDFSRQSSDSRTWGPVPRKDITGVGTLVYFPFGRVRVLK